MADELTPERIAEMLEDYVSCCDDCRYSFTCDPCFSAALAARWLRRLKRHPVNCNRRDCETAQPDAEVYVLTDEKGEDRD